MELAETTSERLGTYFNGDGDNSRGFTDEEVKAAKEIRDKIIQNQTSTLKTATHKTIYMAGEICMWDELRHDKVAQNENLESDTALPAPAQKYSVEDMEKAVKQTFDAVYYHMLHPDTFPAVNEFECYGKFIPKK